MSAKRTAFAATVIVADTLVLGPLITLLGMLTLRRWHRTDILAKAWARIILLGCGVRVGARGLSNLERGQHYILVGNHQSHVDAPTILATVPQKVRFVAKRSLFYIPVFGQAIWAAGNIPVNRKAGKSARRRIEQVRSVVGKELSVLFFAEGTRSDDGSLGPFKKGAAALAIETQVPIVPFAVAGTRDVLPKGFHLVRSGSVGIAFGKVIPTAGLGDEDRARLTEQLRAAVEALLPEAEAARQEA